MGPSVPTLRHRRRPVACVVAIMGIVVSMAAAPPGAAQTAPYTTWPAENAVSHGFTPTTVIVGDSLLTRMNGGGQNGVTRVASHLKDSTWRTTYASAASGASWMNYAWPGQENNNALVWALANFLDARLTIAALATNDAVLITNHSNVYNAGTQYAVMAGAADQVLAHSECFLLVNVSARATWTMSLAAAQAVNANMHLLDTREPDVFVADWNAHSAGHPEWFIPGDVHMTPAGELYYLAFIRDQAKARMANNGC